MIKVVAVEFDSNTATPDELGQLMAVMSVIVSTFNTTFPELNLGLVHVREVEE